MARREEELSRARLSLAKHVEARRDAQQRARRAAAQSGGVSSPARGDGAATAARRGTRTEEEDEFYDCEENLTPQQRRLVDAVSPTAVCTLLQQGAMTTNEIVQRLLQPLALDKATTAEARRLLRSTFNDLEAADRVMVQIDEDRGLLFHLKH